MPIRPTAPPVLRVLFIFKNRFLCDWLVICKCMGKSGCFILGLAVVIIRFEDSNFGRALQDSRIVLRILLLALTNFALASEIRDLMDRNELFDLIGSMF
ncbi:unnamed protein product [Thelazia callipaeda]|uniref:Uncharacterized protein n=1 Tax=Thelazia callipaeda TaxID=103827 RepID=A0A0N5DBE7_THECL|nr:unnamed protein product [Thelazia callipaeda]